MSMHQQEIARKVKQQNQNKDLLLNVRAKAFELQTVVSDLIEFYKNASPEEKELFQGWMKIADCVYRNSETLIKLDHKGA